MKKLVSLLFATIFTIGISVAQNQGPRQNRTPEEMAKNQVTRLTEQLSLNKTQQDSILAVISNSFKTSQAYRANNTEDRSKLEESRTKIDSKIKSFLTAEQLTKYEELLKNRGQRRPQRNN